MANASRNGAAGQVIGRAEDRRGQGPIAGGTADEPGTRREANPPGDVDQDPESAHRLATNKTDRPADQEPAVNPVLLHSVAKRLCVVSNATVSCHKCDELVPFAEQLR